MRLLLSLFTLAGILSVAAPLSAQSLSQDPPVVERITIEFIEIETVAPEAVRAHIQIREGERYDQTFVDRSIRSLYSTGLYDFIEVIPEVLPNGRAAVTFRVLPKYRIGEIRIIGNDRVSDRRLRREMSVQSGNMLDERAVRKDRDAILTYLQEKGFSQATVEYDLQRDPATGLGNVIFIVDEGSQLKIDDIIFVGNEAISSRRLRGVMETSEWWWLSWLTGSGRFDENQLQDDIDALSVFYKDEGYLDVSIPEQGVRLEYPDDDEIIITINIDEGRRYYVGEITFEGNTLFPTSFLVRMLTLFPGDVFSPTKLDEDRTQLQDYYGSAGYLDTFVRAERVPNVETGNIDINYSIEESERFEVESVQVEGNTKTKSVVILRELALRPGDVFNLVRMKNSEARLKNTRFFDEVALSPENTNIPGRRNLKVTVEEGRTGQFQIGAGFSSLEQGVLFFELQQGNFDLFNWRSFFQGDGQKFRLRLSLGSQSNEVVMAFEEPWFLERQLAVGFEAFRRETDFNSAIYNELRTGAEVYFRKRLFELVTGRFAYSYEVVDITDISSQVEDILREAGGRSVSKVSATLVRDTRDDLLFPRRGSRLLFLTEFAGLGGDTEYVKLETRNSFYYPTFDFLDQSISILARTGTFVEYGDSEVPFFDRFFLGGPNTLRGFDFREVGPKDSRFREPIGGRTYGFASFEYTIKIAEPLRLAAFYDWGFVNTDEGDWDPTNFNDNWGIGVRIMVLGNPLRLDYGIPITTDDFNDEGAQFNFAFGTRF